MQIRQIAVVASELEPVRDIFYELLGLDEAHEDPGIIQFGLENIVMTLGNTFLEVVSPVQAGTTAGRLLERRGGDGGYMVIVQVHDLSYEKNRLTDTSIRTVWETDRPHAKAIHLHPKDVPGAIVSLDQMDPPEAWYWAGEGWENRKAKHTGNIVAAEIQSSDPVATAAQWCTAFGVNMSKLDTMPVIFFDETEVRFINDRGGRGVGLSAIDIEASNMSAILKIADSLGLERVGNSVTVCGINLNFVE